MTMNKFDQIIASKLNSTDYGADEALWANIEKELPQQSFSQPQNSISFYAGVAATALILIGLMSMPTLSEQEINKPAVSEQETLTEATSIIPSASSSSEAGAVMAEHQPQENHEIELLLIETKTPITTPAKKANASSEKELVSTAKQEIKQQLSIQETDSKAPAVNTLKNYDFKAIGIQCVEKSVQFESSEKIKNTRWIIDGVHVLEGNKCAFVFNEEGEHEVVMMIDLNGETYSVSKSIEIFEKPNPIINYAVISSQNCFEQSVELSSTPGTNAYSWTFNQTKLSGSDVEFSMPEGRHDIKLTAINPEGCVADVSHEVFVEGGLKIFIPNSFTPDNDGQNDTWFAKGLDKCASFNVQIYRATDQTLVYETSELKPWNGSLQATSEMAQRGDQFLYRISITDECGTTIEKRGPINSL